MRCLLLLLLVAAMGCKAGEGERCAKPDDCGGGLTCDADALQCITAETIACRKANACRGLGYCTAKNGKCQAVKDADCAKFEGCTILGQCTAKDGLCQATKDSDCAKSRAAWCWRWSNGRLGCLRALCIGRWELIFSPGRASNALPVLKHSLYR